MVTSHEPPRGWPADRCFLFLSLSVGAASGDTIRVGDRVDQGSTGYYLDISVVKFTNGARRLSLRATHPSLVGDWVDDIQFQILNKRRQGYSVFIGPGRHKTLVYFGRAEEGGTRVTCRGIKLSIRDAANGNPGVVQISVPQRCVRATKRVKFSYTVWNRGGANGDAAPGHNPDVRRTRWVGRGLG